MEEYVTVSKRVLDRYLKEASKQGMNGVLVRGCVIPSGATQNSEEWWFVTDPFALKDMAATESIEDL